MATRTDDWAQRLFQRRPADESGKTWPLPGRDVAGRYLVDTEVEKTVIERMRFFDANSYMYIARANMLYDLRRPGEELAAALRRLTAPVLMVIDDSDLMFTRAQAEEARALLPDARCFYYDSRNGHLSCLFDTPLFASAVADFLRPGSPVAPH